MLFSDFINYFALLDGWNIPDPKGKPIEVRKIRNQLEQKVSELVKNPENT